MQGLEDTFPCASWLPIICQHPKANNLTWQDIQYNPLQKPNKIVQFLIALLDIGNVNKRWWNRPLIGQQSITEKLIFQYKKLVGRPIPINAIRNYRDLIRQAQTFSNFERKIENERFKCSEFKHFLALKKRIRTHEYNNLNININRLVNGLEAREKYLRLGRTSFEFRGRYHQIFYEYINLLIHSKVSQQSFIDSITQKYHSLYPKIPKP